MFKVAFLVPVAAAFALSGCVGGGYGNLPGIGFGNSGSVMDQASRSVARNVVNSEMSRRLPGVNVAPYTDCVINNASTNELLSLANAASGDMSSAASTVGAIMQRPAATECLSAAARSTATAMAGGSGAYGTGAGSGTGGTPRVIR